MNIYRTELLIDGAYKKKIEDFFSEEILYFNKISETIEIDKYKLMITISSVPNRENVSIVGVNIDLYIFNQYKYNYFNQYLTKKNLYDLIVLHIDKDDIFIKIKFKDDLESFSYVKYLFDLGGYLYTKNIQIYNNLDDNRELIEFLLSMIMEYDSCKTIINKQLVLDKLSYYGIDKEILLNKYKKRSYSYKFLKKFFGILDNQEGYRISSIIKYADKCYLELSGVN